MESILPYFLTRNRGKYILIKSVLYKSKGIVFLNTVVAQPFSPDKKCNYIHCEQDYNILAVVKLSLNVMDVGTCLHVEKCYNVVCTYSVK